MKYCRNCGKELVDEAVVCPGCGVSQENIPTVKSDANASLKGGAIGFLLTFFLGLIGFILCLVLGDEACKKVAKRTFIICIIAVVVLYIILIAIGMSMA